MKEIWCTQKSPENLSAIRGWKGECPKCCVFCEKKNCSLRVCSIPREHPCTWRRSPSEWMMGRLEEKADAFYTHLRRYEYYLKKGFRAMDGTWEGEKLERFRKENPKLYKEISK